MATHGMHNTKTYHVWENMKARCLNKNNPSFNDYGGRGIGICDQWMKFENFYSDMGEAPQGRSIERIDNSLGYEKGNCRWATKAEQQWNRRVSRIVEFDGKAQVLEQWAKEYGIGSGVLNNRIYKLHWSMKDALAKPVKKIKRKSEWQTAQPI